MKRIKHFEQYFWVVLLTSIICGFLFPQWLQPLEGYILYFIMGIMCLLFMKVDVLDIVTHIKQPKFLSYISITHMIAIPLITFFIFKQFVDPITAMAILLLSSLPTGVSSAAFTDIMKGRTSLTLTIVIVTNLLATITIPFLFWLIYKTNLDLDYIALFLNLLKIVLIPFAIAKIIKHVIFKNDMSKYDDYYNGGIMAILSLMIMVSIAFNSEYILLNWQTHLKTMGILFIMFFVLQLLGYFSVFWHKKGEKIAVANAKMIVNNILGVVLAIAFFPPEIVTIVIVSLVPWNAMIILKHWYKKYLP
jgi:bile acid:Na+ symporter, BASS family